MAKKTTKRDVILSDARIRLENAKTNLAEQQRLLLAAELVVQAHQESYDALERSLAATPRKKAVKKEQTVLTDVSKEKVSA